jgi:Protein of unknown function (DUF1592)/Protein of unknown function (DUF1588)/Protein of unknown function (DUF1587)/Protein of unknown function (DUF1585)/Protein of unknown function (DUF1595)
MDRLQVRRDARRLATACPSAAAMLVLVGSCTGSIGPLGSSAPPPGGGGGGGVDGTQSALCQSAAPSPGPSYIRRVNRLEYNNTVRDLLGDASAPANGFPAEEKRLGFDNNAEALSVSPVLAEQYLKAAETVATTAVNNHWSTLVPCAVTTTGAAAVDGCGHAFIAAFGPQAYRRPLTADDTTVLTTVFDAGKTTDLKTGIRLVIETALQSPRFLYRVEFGVAAASGQQVVKVDDWEMASRLSYLLWHSMPDAALFSAAQAGHLSSPGEIQAQVQRMVADPKARGVVSDFNNQWLRVGEIENAEKLATVFPNYSASIAKLMEQETTQFLDYVTWDGAGDLDAILTAPFTFVNGPLAQYYGLSGVSGAAFVKTALDGSTHRAGVLTQGGLLSLLGKANQTSPVHRGKFVREQMLCMQLPPPPADIMIKPPELSTTLTTRQRFTQHSIDPACTGCHHLMDPIGLGFEDFDGAGIFRATENGQPVDDSGEVKDSDVPGMFHGVGELSGKLASSAQVQSCVATHWFRYGYGRGETDSDSCSMTRIKSQFAAGGFKIRDLLIALTQTDAFTYRQVTPPAGGI